MCQSERSIIIHDGSLGKTVGAARAFHLLFPDLYLMSTSAVSITHGAEYRAVTTHGGTSDGHTPGPQSTCRIHYVKIYASASNFKPGDVSILPVVGSIISVMSGDDKHAKQTV